MTKELRKGAFILQLPKKPNAPKGTCRWCGKKLTGKNASRRNYCYPNREKRNCKNEVKRAWVWNTREVVRRLAVMQGQTYLHCDICHKQCERLTKTGIRTGKTILPWQADHIIALADGGKHIKENLRCLCVNCHKKKTYLENKRRRNKR